jgi:ParB family transcriptional regulator, chromosome partitioning protein
MSPTRTRGQKINLSDLAGDPDLDDGRPYAVAGGSGTRPVPLTQLALNPFNRRVLAARPEALAELAASMRANGQLQPCTVVTRAAFRHIFPDDDQRVGPAAFVHVTGARRHTAARDLGWESLEVVVKDELADTALRFLSATAAENLDRQDFDPIEEAEQVQLVVEVARSGQAAAAQLQRSPGWVSQRLNLLKLIPEVQAALRTGDVPLREVRTMHTRGPDEQLAELRRLTAPQDSTVAAERSGVPGSDPDAERSSMKRRDPHVAVVRAIRRLGGTPDEIAESLRSELSDRDIAQLIQCLTASDR